MSKPEQKIQIAFANYLRLKYPDLLWTISPAGMLTRPAIGILAVRMGYKKGTPDILIFEPRGIFHGLLIELKAAEGKVSDDQTIFIAKAHLLRYATAVCWSYEEAIETVDNYMSLNPNYGSGVRSNGSAEKSQR
jgi:hypothetical protein